MPKEIITVFLAYVQGKDLGDQGNRMKIMLLVILVKRGPRG